MKGLMLIAAVLMVLVVGFLAVAMMGRVLAKQRERNTVEPLRVGLPSHMAADIMKETARAFAAAYPNVPLEIVRRTHSELIRELEDDQLDVIVVSEKETFPSAEEFHIKSISLHQKSTKVGGFSIEPIVKENAVQYVLWRRYPARRTAAGFVDCLSAAGEADSVSQENMV